MIDTTILQSEHRSTLTFKRTNLPGPNPSPAPTLPLLKEPDLHDMRFIDPDTYTNLQKMRDHEVPQGYENPTPMLIFIRTLRRNAEL